MRVRVVVNSDFKQLPENATSSEKFKGIQGGTAASLSIDYFFDEMKPFKAVNIHHQARDLRIILIWQKAEAHDSLEHE